ncbi:MAG: hypothetical protein GEU73_05255 [Chloroflexi bacterium]|nr:hypothetical protein [Chloroflexota bacterium]
MSRELAARLYESVADDERLRGTLTDAGYGPLLEWCAGRATVLAAKLAVSDLEVAASALRASMELLVRAAETGNRAGLAAIGLQVVPAERAMEATAALARAPDEADARAQVIAAALTKDTR